MNNGSFNVEVSLRLGRFLINKKLEFQMHGEINCAILNGYKIYIFQLMSQMGIREKFNMIINY